MQLVLGASVVMTLFFRVRVDELHANDYMGVIYYSLLSMVIDGIPELSMTISRLPVFYNQRELYFYPAWAYAIPAAVTIIPLSLFKATVWTCLTYYGIGFSPEAGR